MNSNVRSLFIAIMLIICALSSYAEDWSESDWEVVQEGKCYPSIEAFKKNNSSVDEEVRVFESDKTSKEKYYWVDDLTPARGGDTLVYRKEKDDRVCLIALLKGGVGASWYNFSDDGTILEVKTNEYIYERHLPHREIIYRPNEQGRFFPSECTLIGNTTRKYDCLKGEGTIESVPVLIPASFDCSDLSKLSRSEYAVCTDGEFSELDSILAKNYEAFQSADIGDLRTKLINDQRDWVKYRDNCGSNLGCLYNQYTDRIETICTNYPVVSGDAPVCIPAPEKPDPNRKIE